MQVVHLICVAGSALATVMGTYFWLSTDGVLPRLPNIIGPTSSDSSLNATALLKTAKDLWNDIKPVLKEFPELPCGAYDSDILALLSVAHLLRVEVILESGTGTGRTAWFMGRFLSDVKVVTVDLSGTGKNSSCTKHVQAAHAKLATLPNVEAHIGDSFKAIPELMKKHKGKRIGLFIDGPKETAAVKLCAQSLLNSSDVKYCIFHDAKNSGRRILFRSLSQWGRTVALLCCWQPWVDAWPNGSMGLVAGTDYIPFGATNDTWWR
uniref:Methyltransferase domain-containing protein n=1 Tax=Pyrodinium bahamense TaxID=73915 RepID=A0A7S0A2I6_9DINO